MSKTRSDRGGGHKSSIRERRTSILDTLPDKFTSLEFMLYVMEDEGITPEKGPSLIVTLRGLLKALVKSGYLVKSGKDRNTVYELSNKGV